MTPRLRAGDRRAGFALPAVLIITAVVTLVFLVTAQALESYRREALAAADAVRFRERGLSLEAQVGFLAINGSYSVDGLALGRRRVSDLEAFGLVGPPQDAGDPMAADRVLTLDGRALDAGPADPRQPRGRTLAIALQDGGGLLNVNYLTPDQRLRLFRLLGVPEAEQGTMAARLVDYLDYDDLRQPDGAERDEYERAGLGAPQNGPLTRVSQLTGLLGFKELVPADRWRAVRDSLIADPTRNQVNLNTATDATLAVLYDLPSDRIAAVKAQRAAQPFRTFDEFAAVAGGGVGSDVLQSYIIPAGRILLRVVDRETGLTYRSAVAVTPGGVTRPVWFDDQSVSPATPAERRIDLSRAERLPAPPPGPLE